VPAAVRDRIVNETGLCIFSVPVLTTKVVGYKLLSPTD
jgi:hypothetical protein